MVCNKVNIAIDLLKASAPNSPIRDKHPMPLRNILIESAQYSVEARLSLEVHASDVNS